MERPGTSLLTSIAVHAAVVLAVVGYGLLGFTREPLNVESAVPVSIISETVVQAAAPDNPSEELVTEDAATALVAFSASMAAGLAALLAAQGDPPAAAAAVLRKVRLIPQGVPAAAVGGGAGAGSLGARAAPCAGR